MLSSKDQKVYREGIQEIYETLGYYCYFHPLEKEQYTINIYNERVPVSDEEKESTDPLPIICKPTFELSDHLDRFKQRRGSNDDVLLEIPSSELENNDISLSDLEQGKIMFNNRMYEVYFIQPKSVFADMVVTYGVSCRGVEVI